MSRTSRRQFAKLLTLLPLAATELAAKVPRKRKPPEDLGALVARLRRFPLVNADEPDVTFSSLTKRW